MCGTSEIRTKVDLLNRLASMAVVPGERFVEALQVHVVPELVW